MLVHDFPSASSSSSPSSPPSSSSGGHTYSITLVGHASIHEAGDEAAERYRALHLQHNPDYAQFIVGPHIAVLTLQVESARICDVLDKVGRAKALSHTRSLIMKHRPPSLPPSGSSSGTNGRQALAD